MDWFNLFIDLFAIASIVIWSHGMWTLVRDGLAYRQRRKEETARAVHAARAAAARAAAGQALAASLAEQKRRTALAVLRTASGMVATDPEAMRKRALFNSHPDHGGTCESFRQVKKALEDLGL